jgi:hypothetical protein
LLEFFACGSNTASKIIRILGLFGILQPLCQQPKTRFFSGFFQLNDWGGTDAAIVCRAGRQNIAAFAVETFFLFHLFTLPSRLGAMRKQANLKPPIIRQN